MLKRAETVIINLNEQAAIFLLIGHVKEEENCTQVIKKIGIYAKLI